MRNDARPIGEHSPASPIGVEEQRKRSPFPSERSDDRESVTHDHQWHIVNGDAEANEPDKPGNPVMPTNDSTLNTKI